MRQKEKSKYIKLTGEIKEHLNKCIEKDWSPEQIAGRLKEKGVFSLHHETIYQYILSDRKAGGTLYKHLRHQNKTYRKRFASERNRRGIPNRVDIDERPEGANNRERIGDWEADTIIGEKKYVEYYKVSGPDWLTVSKGGILTGTPTSDDRVGHDAAYSKGFGEISGHHSKDYFRQLGTIHIQGVQVIYRHPWTHPCENVSLLSTE